jgi:hypothetical protein
VPPSLNKRKQTALLQTFSATSAPYGDIIRDSATRRKKVDDVKGLSCCKIRPYFLIKFIANDPCFVLAQT